MAQIAAITAEPNVRNKPFEVNGARRKTGPAIPATTFKNPRTVRFASISRIFSDVEICGLDKSFFHNLAATVRALCWRFQNIIPHARIGAGNAIEDVIERDLCAFCIALLAGFDKLLGFVEIPLAMSPTICSSGEGSKKSLGMRADFIS